MLPIHVLVVDDEPEAREGVLALLRGDPEIEVVGECATGDEAVDAIERLRPDLVLLDIQMPGLDGFGVLQAVGVDRMPTVVFVTAYDEYALRAFEAHALDYLLKPFSDERFADAIARARERVRQCRVGELGEQLAALLQERPATEQATRVRASRPDDRAGDGDAPGERYLERIAVRHRKDTLFVNVADLDWVGAADYYVKLHAGGRTHMIRESMQQLETKLDPRRFVRIHRSAIVNIDRVKLIQPYVRGGYVVVMHDGTKLIMSRGRRETLERAIGQSI